MSPHNPLTWATTRVPSSFTDSMRAVAPVPMMIAGTVAFVHVIVLLLEKSTPPTFVGAVTFKLA